MIKIKELLSLKIMIIMKIWNKSKRYTFDCISSLLFIFFLKCKYYNINNFFQIFKGIIKDYYINIIDIIF
jgi:hypothetical protein